MAPNVNDQTIVVPVSPALAVGAHAPISISYTATLSTSTSGDYATDVLGDPWDFNNFDDVPPIPIVGSENSFGISLGNGVLNVDARNG